MGYSEAYKLEKYLVEKAKQDQAKEQYEPPRLYRRVFYLSQAAIPDRIKLS